MLETIHGVLWGMPAFLAFSAFGLYFSCKSGFRQLTGVKRILRSCAAELGRREGGITAFSSMATALGGTVGIGSTAGVALALAAGGPGSIFWMWVTGLLGCMLKYAEVFVAVRYREHKNGIACGGAMYALKKSGRPNAAKLFCALCVAAAFFTGGVTQSGETISAAARSGVSPFAAGAVFALCVLFAVCGGRKAIARISAVAVPAAGFVYLLAAAGIICTRLGALPGAFAQIFGAAFGLKQVSGGISGAAFAAAVRTGVARGVFSTECGMGSSAIVHASNETATPETQGDWGILEVYADIFVFSTLTALALLVTGAGSGDVMFRLVYGRAGEIVYICLTAVFGFAAIISWCFYAESALVFAFKNPKKALYAFRSCLAACVFAGAYAVSEDVWYAADIINLCLSAPNMYLLFIKRKEICSCLKT